MTRARNFTRRRGNRDPARNANDEVAVVSRLKMWIVLSRVRARIGFFFQVMPN